MHTVLPSVDVVIVNWNAGALLEKCIESVLAGQRAGFTLASIIVVDNGSTDGSLAPIEARWPAEVRVIRAAQNLGFGRACNLGARAGRGDWLLFLNPDARVYTDSLAKTFVCLRERDDASSIAVCGIKLVDESGHTARCCARLPSARMFVVAALGLDKLMPRLFGTHIMSEWDHESTRLVDHVIGAFYLIRRVTFAELNGFDERFFVYLEDLDLSWRVRARGLRVLYSADAVAYHMGGGTSRAVLARRLAYSLHSRLLFARKHFSGVQTTTVFITTLLLEPVIRVVRALVTFKPRDAWNVLRAYGLLYRRVLGTMS